VRGVPCASGERATLTDCERVSYAGGIASVAHGFAMTDGGGVARRVVWYEKMAGCLRRETDVACALYKDCETSKRLFFGGRPWSTAVAHRAY